jgi:CheY-like chemotaxis protein
MELLTRDSLRIVHVEDDNDFAQLSEIFLQRAGFKQPIVRCNDGIFAIHYFSKLESEHMPHVILLDLHMPHMNGLEVLHWLRHSYSKRAVAIYLLTSSKNPEDMRRAQVGGVTKYLFKTPLFDDLVQNLDHLIAITNDQRLEDVPSTRCANQFRSSSRPPRTGIIETKRLTIWERVESVEGKVRCLPISWQAQEESGRRELETAAFTRKRERFATVKKPLHGLQIEA